MMHSRRAAFAALRRLALRDFIEPPRRLPLATWSKPAAYLIHRPFHLSAPRCQDKPKQQPAESTEPKPANKKDYLSYPEREARTPPPGFEKQAYEMTFTCKPCGTRSSHRITKQGYHFGSVLITCPECKNKHVISDHLGIFLDRAMTIEDLLREKGQLVKKGTLSDDGDLEFWQDGTQTRRSKPSGGEGGLL